MPKKLVGLIVMAGFATLSAALTTGCAATQRSEYAAYAKDGNLEAQIHTALSADPLLKTARIQVNSVNGEVELSGIADIEDIKDRAGVIASAALGVGKVHNNILLPTGR